MFRTPSRIRALVSATLLLMACTLSSPNHVRAENSLVDAFSNWVIEGVKPQDINGPNCQSDSEYLLGHFSSSDPGTSIKGPISEMCNAKGNRFTGQIPPLVYACYTTDPTYDFFDAPHSEQKLCYCDYYLCDPTMQEPFEKAVEAIVGGAMSLGL
ncbi:MAG: hypothetical protein RL518_507 [Pseudomonadota bacterium]